MSCYACVVVPGGHTHPRPSSSAPRPSSSVGRSLALRHSARAGPRWNGEMTPIPCAHSEESTSVDYDAQWAWRGRGGKGDGYLIACSHQPIPCASSCESGTGPGRDAVERHGIHDVKRANQPLRALVLTTPAHPPSFPRGPYGTGWPRKWPGGSVVLQLPCLIPGVISAGATRPR